MAIAYLDGGRITGLSTAAKPYNVPIGSSFVETDSGATLVYNGTTWIYDTFESINDAFGKSGGVTQRHHFIDWFSGSTLDTEFIWTLNHIGGSNCTATLDDSIDGGLKMYVNDTDNSSPSMALTFGASSRRPFSYNGCTIIGNMKKGTVNLGAKYGLGNDSTVTPPSCVLFAEGTLYSYKSLETNDEAVTATDIALDTAWWNFKIDLKDTICELYLNGVLRTSKTTSLPTTDMQPFLYIQSRGTAGEKYWNTTYCEAYNH